MTTVTWDDATPDVNQEVTATFTFKDNDVRAVYIDWDDGKSNKKEESNYQWKQLSEPRSTFTQTHTYNKQGTFKPVVQTVNSWGYVSRYYQNTGSNSNITPFTSGGNIDDIVVSDAAPTAIMRVENTTFNTGIDNSIFEAQGPQPLYLTIAPTLTQAELNTIGQVVVEIEAVVNYNKINSASGVEAQLALGSDYSQETLSVTLDTTTTSASQFSVVDVLAPAAPHSGPDIKGAISKVLKLKYNSPKATGTTAANPGTNYSTNELFNRLKIFLVTKAEDGKYYPVSYVSAGMPVKTVEGYGNYISMDFSQSRTAASNLSIDNYRYDNGKGWFSPTNQWTLSTNILSTGTKQVSGSVTRDVYYSYLTNPNGLNGNAGQELFYSGNAAHWYYSTGTTSGSLRYDLIGLDDYGRIYDQIYDVRTSVVSTSTSGSSIITNQPEVLLVKPTSSWTGAPDITQNPASSYTSNMKNNGSGNSFPLTSLNSTAQKDILGVTIDGAEKDYILLTFDSKTNKIFFGATNYANLLQSSGDLFDPSINGLKIAGVQYLHVENSGTKTQNAYWKPLKFTDTTRIDKEYRLTGSKDYVNYYTSFAKNGYISFDMPLDWSTSTIKQLCGGVYNTDTTSFAACIASGANDVLITGSCANVDGDSDGYGDRVTITNATAADLQEQLETIGGADDVGAYKYALVITTGTASGSMFWIASGGSNGWSGSTAVTVQVGTTGTSTVNANYAIPAGTITGAVRRINIYDVVNGASKVFSDGGVETAYADAQLIPAGGEYYNAGSAYFKNLYNCVDADLTGSAWSTSSKYVLKLTLSGTTNDGTADNPAPELWNIFDATQGDSALVKQIDDTAYNLNSLAITSSVSINRAGTYFKSITRKGRTFIVKTGLSMTQVGFTSVALGDELSSTAFADHGPDTLYGHLHMIRKLQANAVPVYWDEPQKDGTFVRLWGVISDVNESAGLSGRKRVVNYTFNMIIKDVALLTNAGSLMTDIFPLGGLEYEQNYS